MRKNKKIYKEINNWYNENNFFTTSGLVFSKFQEHMADNIVHLGTKC